LDPLLHVGNPQVMKGLTLISLLSAIFTCASMISLFVAHQNNDWIQPLSTPIARAAFTDDQVRGALRLIPTIMLVSVGFGICYNTGDVALSIACQMDMTMTSPFWKALNPGAKGGQFNGNFFSIGNTGAIIILILLLESFVYPYLRKKNMMFGKKTGFALGFFFAVLMEVSAILIEIARKHKSDSNQFVPCPAFELEHCIPGNFTACFCAQIVPGDEAWYWLSQCGPVTEYTIQGISAEINPPMAAISAWWILIPEVLQGVAEILVNPPMYDFVFDECPAPLRSMMQGFQLLANGCLAQCVSNFFAFMIPDNFDKGSGLQNVVIYFIVTAVCAILSQFLYRTAALPDRQHDEPELQSS